MKVSIITEKKDWICKRAAEELCKYIPNCVIDGDYQKADIVYLLPYTGIGRLGKIKGKLVSLFTHYEAGGNKAALWKLALEKSDHQIFMSNVFYKPFGFREYLQNIDPDFDFNSRKIIPWASDLSSTSVVFGVCGKARPRKRPEFVEQLVADGFNVVANGDGWPNCSFNFNNHSKQWRKDFYLLIDYLIVTSDLEGGPVPLFDAIACKKPVIAPEIGSCAEFPVIPYDGSYSDLKKVCTKLANPRRWEDFAKEHQEFFEGVYNGSL